MRVLHLSSWLHYNIFSSFVVVGIFNATRRIHHSICHLFNLRSGRTKFSTWNVRIISHIHPKNYPFSSQLLNISFHWTGEEIWYCSEVKNDVLPIKKENRQMTNGVNSASKDQCRAKNLSARMDSFTSCFYPQ